MLVFGHAGITLGAAIVSANWPTWYAGSVLARFGHFMRGLDLRVLIIGSLLPDIIDKPVGLYFFRETFSNGRIFSHSLLFLLILSVAGLWLLRRGRSWAAALALGTFTHLLFDGMWESPRTLLWPAFGWTFDRMEASDWLSSLLLNFRTNPVIFLSELSGFFIMLGFAVWLLRGRKLTAFIRCGRPFAPSPARDTCGRTRQDSTRPGL